MPKNRAQQLIKEDLEEFEEEEDELPDDEKSELCTRCCEIFMNDFQRGRSESQTIMLSHQDAPSCELCALLLDRFCGSDAEEVQFPLELSYWLATREGYFKGVYDIHFKPTMAEVSLKVWKVRLAIQWVNRPDSLYPATPRIHEYLAHATSSPESLRQADDWLENCLKNHENCRLITPSSRFLPRRLLEINRRQNSLLVRVCETNSFEESVQYMALSHCWGSGDVCQLLRSNIDAYSRKIPFNNLSKLFQDAIKFTAWAQVNYIWIDALCIIQDSRKDWKNEASVMGLIYQNARCNIAATGFANGTNGLFASRNQSLLIPIRLNIGNDIMDEGGYVLVKMGKYLLVDVDAWVNGVDFAPLNKRAWVAQERALSIRTIHFGSNQLFWECATSSACEVFPDGLLSGTSSCSPKIFLPFKTDNNGYPGDVPKVEMLPTCFEPKNVRGMLPSLRRWCWMVESYSKGSLTYSRDKLIAISGLAKSVQTDLECPYLAGLWRWDLEHQLVWKVRSPMPQVKMDGTRGPSWSWASVDGGIEMDDWMGYFYSGIPGKVTWFVRVVDVRVKPIDNDEFSQISSGRLTVTSLLGVVRIKTDRDETPVPGHSDDVLVHVDRNMSISWDTQEVRRMFDPSMPREETNVGEFEYLIGPSSETTVWRYSTYGSTPISGKAVADVPDVFYMPFRTMDEDARNVDYEMPMLKGLLLLPKGNKPGEYRRVGQFEISEHWWRNSIAPFTNPTKILSPKRYVSVCKGGQYTITIV